MRIGTNVASLNAQEAASSVSKNLQSSLEKLSSGLRINKAADDASGLAIADKLRTQASSLKQSIDNANSAASFIQIGDKAMAEQSNVLDIVKTKLIQAKNGTTSEAGREAILNDVQKLLTQLDAIATQTNYNGINLLQNSSDASNAANGEEKFTMTDIGSAGNGTVTWAASGAAGASGTISVSVADDATAEEVSAAMVAAINSDATASEYYVAKDNEDGSFSVTSVSFAADFDSAVGGTASGTAGTGTNLGAETQVATATAESGGATTSQAVTFQIGESSGNTVATTGIQANTIGLDLGTLKTMDSGYFTADTAGTMMAVVDSAIDSLNSNRSNFGSVQNQLESAIRNMQTTYTNIKAAESTIRDVDYAQESANFNKQNIIAQAGTYALSQANAIQQNVLKLLQ